MIATNKDCQHGRSFLAVEVLVKRSHFFVLVLDVDAAQIDLVANRLKVAAANQQIRLAASALLGRKQCRVNGVKFTVK